MDGGQHVLRDVLATGQSHITVGLKKPAGDWGAALYQTCRTF